MKYLCVVLGVLLGVCALFITGMAGDNPEVGKEPPPDPGAPEPIKEKAFLVGDWDIKGQTSVGADCEEWTDYAATCSYEYILGGCAFKMEYASEMINTPFMGFMVQTFNRQTDRWQLVWVDNASSRVKYYDGYEKKGKIKLTGTDMWNGEEFLSRIVISDITDTTFNWKMKTSRDQGRTWHTTMKAVYSKKP